MQHLVSILCCFHRQRRNYHVLFGQFQDFHLSTVNVDSWPLRIEQNPKEMTKTEKTLAVA